MLRTDQPIDRLMSAWTELLRQLQEVSDQIARERTQAVEHVARISTLLENNEITQAKLECRQLLEKLHRHVL